MKFEHFVILILLILLNKNLMENIINIYCNCNYPNVETVCTSCIRLAENCHCHDLEKEINDMCTKCNKEKIPDLIESDDIDYKKLIISTLLVTVDLQTKKRKHINTLKIVLKKSKK